MKKHSKLLLEDKKICLAIVNIVFFKKCIPYKIDKPISTLKHETFNICNNNIKKCFHSMMFLHRYNEKYFKTNKFTIFFHFELCKLSWVAKSTKLQAQQSYYYKLWLERWIWYHPCNVQDTTSLLRRLFHNSFWDLPCTCIFA